MSTSSAGSSGFNSKRRPVRVSGLALAILSFQTLGMLSSLPVVVVIPTVTTAPRIGIIYSDIGTSPLYVLNGIWSASGPVPPKDDIIGGVSAIVWSLTLLPLCKYVSFLPLLYGSILTPCVMLHRSSSACTLELRKVGQTSLLVQRYLTCFWFFRRGRTFRTVSWDLSPEVFRKQSYSRLDDGRKEEAR